MANCVRCGNALDSSDSVCANCGAAQPPTRLSSLPAWALTVLVIGPLLVTALVVTLVLAPRRDAAASRPPTTLTEKQAARQTVVEDGIHAIQVAIQGYAVDHDGRYPPAPDVSQSGAVGRHYLDPWPTDIYTGGPMGQGGGPGDFTYTVSPDGTSYRLVGHFWPGEGDVTVP